MRKIKFVKIVIPELVSVTIHGSKKLPDYRCTGCGMGLSDDYSYCPYCGSELDWTKMDEKSEQFWNMIMKKYEGEVK